MRYLTTTFAIAFVAFGFWNNLPTGKTVLMTANPAAKTLAMAIEPQRARQQSSIHGYGGGAATVLGLSFLDMLGIHY